MTFYGTVEAFRTYNADRGHNVNTYQNDDVEAALLRASEWLDALYRPLFRGWKVGYRAQVREWPRAGVTDRYGYAVGNSVPVEIENGTYEAARRELESPGSLTKDFTRSKYNRVSVDGAVSVQFANVDASDVQVQIPIVDMILEPLLGRRDRISSLSGSVVRA